MSDVLYCKFCCEKIVNKEVWLLDSIPDFTERKLSFGICPKCKTAIVKLTETRVSDGQVFVNDNISGRLAIRTIAREKKRLITKLYSLTPANLSGFIYGVNKEIRYKNTTKIRQYSADFKSNYKTKCKEITVQNGIRTSKTY